MNLPKIVEIAEAFIKKKSTVRKIADDFNVSKSTVWKELTSDKFKKYYPSLYEECRKIMEQNKSERHIRGGIATKNKYEKAKKQ